MYYNNDLTEECEYDAVTLEHSKAVAKQSSSTKKKLAVVSATFQQQTSTETSVNSVLRLLNIVGRSFLDPFGTNVTSNLPGADKLLHHGQY